MDTKILITGPPRSGKSTLINRLIEHYRSKSIKLDGFLTPEIREKGKRVGFEAKRIHDDNKILLAKKGDYSTKHRLGSYSVFTQKFDDFIEFLVLFNKKSDQKLLIIDEIGKMELFSDKFTHLVKQLFKSQIPIIATIGLNLKHKIKDWLLSLDDISLYHLNKNNQQEIFNDIVSKISNS